MVQSTFVGTVSHSTDMSLESSLKFWFDILIGNVGIGGVGGRTMGSRWLVSSELRSSVSFSSSPSFVIGLMYSPWLVRILTVRTR